MTLTKWNERKKNISIFYLPVLDERTYSSLWSSKIYWQQVRDSQESHVRPMFGAHRVIRILLFLLRSVVSLAEVWVDALVSVTFSDKEVACSSHLLLYMPVTFFLDCSCSFFFEWSYCWVLSWVSWVVSWVSYCKLSTSLFRKLHTHTESSLYCLNHVLAFVFSKKNSYRFPAAF